MSRLAAIAEEHYRRWLPQAYAEIKDRVAYFQELEDEAQSQLETLEESFLGPDPEAETFADRMTRFNWARHRAEEIVIREVLLAEPEETASEREDARREAQANAELVMALEEFQGLLGQRRDQRD